MSKRDVVTRFAENIERTQLGCVYVLPEDAKALLAELRSVEDATSEVCSCADWEPGIARLDGPIVLAQLCNPALRKTPEFQFVAFRFCPWCGKKSRAPSSTERSPE